MPTLSALSPFGPIFGKELRTTARRKRTYFLRVAYLGGLLLLLLLAYTSTRGSQSASVAYRQQQQAEMGYAFFCCFSMFCVISMALIGPVLTATAISSERQQKTLHVLLMTPINSWQIISGKLFSRLLAALTLIGLSLPALAVARLLGGVELDQMFAVICLCTVTALSAAAIGLFYSTFMTRAYAVILLSYATLALLYLFVPFIVMAFAMNSTSSRRGGPPMLVLEFIAAIAPPWSVGMVISGQRMFGTTSWITSVVVALVLTAVLVMFCGLILRRIARRAGGANVAAAPPMMPPIFPAANLAAAPGTPFPPSPAYPGVLPPPLPLDAFGGAPPLPPLAYASVPLPGRIVGDNPVLWRELRRPLMTRRWQAIAGAIACIVLLIFSYVALVMIEDSALKDPGVQCGYAVVFNAVLMLLACVVSATAIGGEKETDTWTLLLATPLSAGQIIRGKFLGLLRRMLWPFVLIVAHFTLFSLITGGKAISPLALLITLWVMFSFNILWVTTGLYLSLRFKRVTTAVIVNLLLPVAAYLLVMALLAIVGNLVDRSDDWVEFVGWYAPYPYLVSAINGLTRSGYRSLWLPYNHDPNPTEFCWTVFIVGAIYMAAAALLLARMVKRFDHIVGRSVQRKG